MPSPSHSPDDVSPDFTFLKAVPRLLSDSQRRLREPARGVLDLNKPQSERIAELIARLEDVRGDKVSWPGPYVLMFDPICRALSQEGEAAVDALLLAYEFDDPLTSIADFR